MSERRYNDETYRDHEIRVLAERVDAASAWTIEIHIQSPDGTHLPTICDTNRSFQDIDFAFTTGSEVGRNTVDSL